MKAGEMIKALADFFPESAISWLPGVTTKDKKKAMAMPYITARDVMDRLDSVVGAANWQTKYTVVGNGIVICELSVRLESEWITKSDVGGSNEEQNKSGKGENQHTDHAKQFKAAFSDALKRAAIHFGIGRYLYNVPDQWCPFDGWKFAPGPEQPRMPPKYLPGGKSDTPKPAAAEKNDSPTEKPESREKKPPKNGAELKKRMNDAEKAHPGIFQFVSNCGQLRGFPIDMGKWSASQIADSIKFASEYLRRKDPKSGEKRITDEQDATIRKLADNNPETILTACKAAGVFAGDQMTKAEADKVIMLLKDPIPAETA